MCFAALIINLQSGDFHDSWSCSETARPHNAKQKQESRSISWLTHTQDEEEEYNVDADYPGLWICNLGGLLKL